MGDVLGVMRAGAPAVIPRLLEQKGAVLSFQNRMLKPGIGRLHVRCPMIDVRWPVHDVIFIKHWLQDGTL